MDKDEIKHGTVETYAGDMAKVLEDDKAGLIKKIIHEQEESEEARKNYSPDSRRNKIYMFLSFFFIIFALVTLFVILTKGDLNTTQVETTFTPLIFSDKSTSVEVAGLGKDEIGNEIRSALNNSTVKQGGVEGIYLTEQGSILGLRKFISALNLSFAPGGENLVHENFLLGIVNNNKKDFFVLIKVRELADIFPSLRAWEGNMFSQVHQLFGVKVDETNRELLTKPFEDGVVENKNARVLRDSEGNIVLMYVFIDNNSVVISDSNLATREVMLRLLQSGTKR
jgi:hypothetical protein